MNLEFAECSDPNCTSNYLTQETGGECSVCQDLPDLSGDECSVCQDLPDLSGKYQIFVSVYSQYICYLMYSQDAPRGG